MTTATLSAVVWREPKGFVSLCPELDVASCGDTAEEALEMLREAVELYLESAEELGLKDGVLARLATNDRLSTTIDVALPWAS